MRLDGNFCANCGVGIVEKPVSMKRSPEWLKDHAAKMAKYKHAIGNVELVELKRIGAGFVDAVAVGKATPKERYPNLLIMLHEAGLPPPVIEYPFAGASLGRRWRFDYAWPRNEKVALEVDGGVWTQGRHTRGQGFIDDQDKMNAATMLGWRVIHTTPDRLEDAVRCVRTLIQGEAAAA
jgi:hypothetical protein